MEGSLYSFWVSPRENGASFGHVAAGGPGLKGAIDDVGLESRASGAGRADGI
jgi:hypothetical protein